jgi:hypothetical protein
MRASSVAVFLLLFVRHSLVAQCGEEAGAPYSVMNATLLRIWLNSASSRHHDWQDLPLDPSQSAAFDGELTRVKVRFGSGRILEYQQRNITAIRSRSHLQRGDWIIERSGLRFVSCAERQRRFEALRKPLAQTPNQTMQPTAGPCTASLSMTNTRSFQAKLGSASGG